MGPFTISCRVGKEQIYLMVENEAHSIQGTEDEKEASLFYVLPTEDLLYPADFFITYKGTQQDINKTLSLIERLEYTVSPPSYLSASSNVFGYNVGPLRIKNTANISHIRFCLQSRIRSSPYMCQYTPMSWNTWLEGEKCYISCNHHSPIKLSGFVAIEKETKSEAGEETYSTVTVPMIKADVKKKELGMLFELHKKEMHSKNPRYKKSAERTWVSEHLLEFTDTGIMDTSPQAHNEQIVAEQQHEEKQETKKDAGQATYSTVTVPMATTTDTEEQELEIPFQGKEIHTTKVGMDSRPQKMRRNILAVDNHRQETIPTGIKCTALQHRLCGLKSTDPTQKHVSKLTSVSEHNPKTEIRTFSPESKLSVTMPPDTCVITSCAPKKQRANSETFLHTANEVHVSSTTSQEPTIRNINSDSQPKKHDASPNGTQIADKQATSQLSTVKIPQAAPMPQIGKVPTNAEKTQSLKQTDISSRLVTKEALPKATPVNVTVTIKKNVHSNPSSQAMKKEPLFQLELLPTTAISITETFPHHAGISTNTKSATEPNLSLSESPVHVPEGTPTQTTMNASCLEPKKSEIYPTVTQYVAKKTASQCRNNTCQFRKKSNETRIGPRQENDTNPDSAQIELLFYSADKDQVREKTTDTAVLMDGHTPPDSTLNRDENLLETKQNPNHESNTSEQMGHTTRGSTHNNGANLNKSSANAHQAPEVSK